MQTADPWEVPGQPWDSWEVDDRDGGELRRGPGHCRLLGSPLAADISQHVQREGGLHQAQGRHAQDIRQRLIGHYVLWQLWKSWQDDNAMNLMALNYLYRLRWVKMRPQCISCHKYNRTVSSSKVQKTYKTSTNNVVSVFSSIYQQTLLQLFQTKRNLMVCFIKVTNISLMFVFCLMEMCWTQAYYA